MQKEWRDSWSATRCHFDVLRIIKSTPQGIERSAAMERLERLEPERAVMLGKLLLSQSRLIA